MDLVLEYSKGKSLNQISKEVGISIPTITKRLKAMGVYVKNNKDRSLENHDGIIQKIRDLQRGQLRKLTYKELGIILGLHTQTVGLHMRRELKRMPKLNLSEGKSTSP